MRASTIFILLFNIQVMLLAQQESLLNRKVSVSFSNTSIEEILKSLETNELSFVYSPEVFDVKKRVSINRNQVALSSVLSELFVGQQMEMREMNGQILLRKKVIPKEKEASVIQPPVKEESVITQEEKVVQKADSISQKTVTVASTGNLQEEPKATVQEAPQGIIQDSTDSFGYASNKGQGNLIAQTSIFIPDWPKKPYVHFQYSGEPEILNYSSFRPERALADQNGASIWDKMADSNKKAQAKERTEKPARVKSERAIPERKFRAGLATYTGYTEINNTPSLLLGGRVMYYPYASFGVGVGGNAFMTRSFFNQELNQDIRLEGGYGGLTLEYALFPLKRVHLNIPLTIGGGGFTYVDAQSPIGAVNPAGSQAFFVLEAGAEVEINVTKFMKVGFGASVRSVSGTSLLNENNQQEIINASVLDGMNYGIVLKFGRF